MQTTIIFLDLYPDRRKLSSIPDNIHLSDRNFLLVLNLLCNARAWIASQVLIVDILLKRERNHHWSDHREYLVVDP